MYLFLFLIFAFFSLNSIDITKYSISSISELSLILDQINTENDELLSLVDIDDVILNSRINNIEYVESDYTKKMLDLLKNKSYLFFGLTARFSDQNLETVSSLKKLKILFSEEIFFEYNLIKLDQKVFFYKGIIFTNRYNKGLSCIEILNNFSFYKKPTHILFIDDRGHHLEDFEEAFLNGLHFKSEFFEKLEKITLIHYTFMEQNFSLWGD
jgi:hypothetical protein